MRNISKCHEASRGFSATVEFFFCLRGNIWHLFRVRCGISKFAVTFVNLTISLLVSLMAGGRHRRRGVDFLVVNMTSANDVGSLAASESTQYCPGPLL